MEYQQHQVNANVNEYVNVNASTRNVHVLDSHQYIIAFDTTLCLKAHHTRVHARAGGILARDNLTSSVCWNARPGLVTHVFRLILCSCVPHGIESAV